MRVLFCVISIGVIFAADMTAQTLLLFSQITWQCQELCANWFAGTQNCCQPSFILLTLRFAFSPRFVLFLSTSAITPAESSDSSMEKCLSAFRRQSMFCAIMMSGQPACVHLQGSKWKKCTIFDSRYSSGKAYLGTAETVREGPYCLLTVCCYSFPDI